MLLPILQSIQSTARIIFIMNHHNPFQVKRALQPYVTINFVMKPFNLDQFEAFIDASSIRMDKGHREDNR